LGQQGGTDKNANHHILDLEVPKGASVQVYGSSIREGDGGRLSVVVGALSDGISREIVFKVDCPSGEKGFVAPFRLNAHGRSEGSTGSVCSDATTVRLTLASEFTNLVQMLDEEQAQYVLTAWYGEILTTVARLKRDRSSEEASSYVERELKHFKRYAANLDGGADKIRDLMQICERIAHQWSARTMKEMSYSASRMRLKTADHRGDEKASWSAHLARD